MSNKRYDIPAKAKHQCKRGSPALQEFYRHFFVNETALIRREVDLAFLRELTPEESLIAKDLIRRNLDRGYLHLIEGTASIRDQKAVPQLKAMLASTSDHSRRLTITGTLWRLVKDPSFPESLRTMAESDCDSLKVAHMHQIAWLGDERAIDMLIGLLGDSDRFVRFLALGRLNEIEHKQIYIAKRPPTPTEDYLSRQDNAEFVGMMVQNLNQWYLPTVLN